MGEIDKYTFEVNLHNYEIKKEMCETCVYFYECRGPSPVDSSCPKNFFYVHALNALDK